jgi:hypothetical protein
MEISLDEAIEIHAKALVRRHEEKAPHHARRHALNKQGCGDMEGHAVWLGVAAAAERILAAHDPAEVEAQASAGRLRPYRGTAR